MSNELKEKIRRLNIVEGLGVVAISQALDVDVEIVRDALGLREDGSAPPVERPALPPGKARSQASIDITAAAMMQAEVTRRTGGKRRSFL